MTLDRYLESAIFKPLNMRSTAFHATPAMTGHIVPAYERGSDGKVVQSSPALAPRYTAAGKMLSGGGGLLSSPADYLRFAQMLLNRGELDGHRVLKHETVDLMLRNHLPPAVPTIQVSPEWTTGKYGFGYGGAVRIDSGAADPGSTGMFRWAGAVSTFFTIDPKEDMIAMVWTQYVPIDWSLDAHFQRLVYDALVK
jgi:CubicO group peptidase (beta-lactamase class C family)